MSENKCDKCGGPSGSRAYCDDCAKEIDEDYENWKKEVEEIERKERSG